jgi:hypothetical protein
MLSFFSSPSSLHLVATRYRRSPNRTSSVGTGVWPVAQEYEGRWPRDRASRCSGDSGAPLAAGERPWMAGSWNPPCSIESVPADRATMYESASRSRAFVHGLDTPTVCPYVRSPTRRRHLTCWSLPTALVCPKKQNHIAMDPLVLSATVQQCFMICAFSVGHCKKALKLLWFLMCRSVFFARYNLWFYFITTSTHWVTIVTGSRFLIILGRDLTNMFQVTD